MKRSLCVFLLTLFTAHYKLNKISSLAQNTADGVQSTPPNNTSATDSSNNVVFKSGSQSYYDLESFNSWTCNTPHVDRFGSAQLFIKSSIETKGYLYRILLYGGIAKAGPGLFSKVRDQDTTWIYYEETNSWKTIDNVANGPPPMSDLNLVTLCRSHAIMVHPYPTNRTWIFMSKQLEWKRVTIVGYGPAKSEYFDIFVAVAVRSSNSSCACSEDVLVFVYLNQGQDSTTQVGSYRIRCVIEHRLYRWKKEGFHNFRSNRAHITSVVTYPSPAKRTLLFVAEKCIWTYSVEKSTWNKTKNCVPTTYSILRAVYLPVTGEILFFSLTNRSIIRLLFSSTSTLYENILGILPNIIQVYSVRVVSDSKLIVYLSEDTVCGSSTWILERNVVARLWAWNKLKETILYPSYCALQSFWKDTYYRIVISSSDVSSANNKHIVQPVMWSLNMRTKKWELQSHLNVTGLYCTRIDYLSADVHKDNNNLYYTQIERNVWLMVSKSYTSLMTSPHDTQQMTHSIPSRSQFTLVTIDSSSALLFGGRTSSGVVLNDLWEFSLAHRMWKKVDTTEHELNIPPRYGHAAAITRFDMFIIGGSNNSIDCIQELWKYNLVKNSWSILVPDLKFLRFIVFKSCRFALVAKAEMLWIAAYGIPISSTSVELSYNVWMFMIYSRTLTLVVQIPMNVQIAVNLSPQITFLQGYLLRFEGNDLLYTRVGCPRGLSSSDISRFPCHFCKVGFYADRVGSTKCSKCPNGTTTKGERSSTVTDCNLCVSDYCLHGRCLVASNSVTQVPVCTCTIGFTGSRCHDATYYYIGTAVVLVIGIVTLLVTVLWRTRKRRRERETAFRRHIQTLNDAWQISWQEIRLQDEIGGGASGRVWKAQYRDMDVAVKMLIGDDDPQSSLEFAQEIKLMQTMRHPNIVLFIGAGTTSAQAQPFLVLEFAHRGSLRHVLGDVSIEIDEKRKIAFALDGSKGMEFLHKLDPPRIHRDVKSDNLLVSQSWIVKVADFGLGKSLRSTREHQHTDRYMPLIDNNSQIDSMYGMSEHLSKDGIGTVRWRAPELSRRNAYDGSIDVYRYSKICIPLIHLLIFLFCLITTVYLVLELFFGRFGHVVFLSSNIGLGTRSMTP